MRAIVYSIAAQLLFMVGCQSMPSVTQTGDMKEIFVRDTVSTAELHVNAGDEVRWTNKRMAPVRIVFIEPVIDKLSCRNNFSGFFTGGNEAVLGPNESASLCFREPAFLMYVVRMTSTLPGGEVNVPGAIRIGGPSNLEQPSAQEQPATRPTDNTVQP